jgi:hypothetical protein
MDKYYTKKSALVIKYPKKMTDNDWSEYYARYPMFGDESWLYDREYGVKLSNPEIQHIIDFEFESKEIREFIYFKKLLKKRQRYKKLKTI